MAAEFQKNATERVRVSLTRFKGVDLVDLRVFYDAGNDEWKPTAKGVSIRRELLPELQRAIEKAQDLAGLELEEEA